MALACRSVTHIAKTDFLPAFKTAYTKMFTAETIKGAFRGAGLIPHNPDVVIPRLDVRLRTPDQPPEQPTAWESQTPSNAREFEAQSTLIRSRIRSHINSSPTSIIESLRKLEKGALATAHKHALMVGEIAQLRETIEAQTKSKRRKWKYIQTQGTLTIEKGAQLATAQGAGRQETGGESLRSGRATDMVPQQRHCGRCGRIGHNVRTCGEVASNTSNSE
jgi:hypothetical protein